MHLVLYISYVCKAYEGPKKNAPPRKQSWDSSIQSVEEGNRHDSITLSETFPDRELIGD